MFGYKILDFPTDYVRPNKKDFNGGMHVFSINKELSEKLRNLAQTSGVTLHTLMLSGLSILLSQYMSQEDIVIGSPTANRHHAQTESLMGFFINIQANRILLKKSQSFLELIKQVHLDRIEAHLHQDLPFELIVDALSVERDTSRHPIFQIIFEVQAFGISKSISDDQKKYWKELQINDFYNVERFDLSIFINDDQAEIQGQITYGRL